MPSTCDIWSAAVELAPNPSQQLMAESALGITRPESELRGRLGIALDYRRDLVRDFVDR